MKAQSQQQPAAHGANVLSSILSFGTACRAALVKILRTAHPSVLPYTFDEVVRMDSPRMQRALQLVSRINNCRDEIDLMYVKFMIVEFNKQYPAPNPLMAFLENKAWDVMACKHINDQKAKQQQLRQEMKTPL